MGFIKKLFKGASNVVKKVTKPITKVVSAITPWKDDSGFGQLLNTALGGALLPGLGIGGGLTRVALNPLTGSVGLPNLKLGGGKTQYDLGAALTSGNPFAGLGGTLGDIGSQLWAGQNGQGGAMGDMSWLGGGGLSGVGDALKQYWMPATAGLLGVQGYNQFKKQEDLYDTARTELGKGGTALDNWGNMLTNSQNAMNGVQPYMTNASGAMNRMNDTLTQQGNFWNDMRNMTDQNQATLRGALDPVAAASINRGNLSGQQSDYAYNSAMDMQQRYRDMLMPAMQQQLSGQPSAGSTSAMDAVRNAYSPMNNEALAGTYDALRAGSRRDEDTAAVRKAFGTLNALDAQAQSKAQNAALAQGMAKRGLSGRFGEASGATSARSGVQNALTRNAAEMGAKGELAAIDVGNQADTAWQQRLGTAQQLAQGNLGAENAAQGVGQGWTGLEQSGLNNVGNLMNQQVNSMGQFYNPNAALAGYQTGSNIYNGLYGAEAMQPYNNLYSGLSNLTGGYNQLANGWNGLANTQMGVSNAWNDIGQGYGGVAGGYNNLSGGYQDMGNQYGLQGGTMMNSLGQLVGSMFGGNQMGMYGPNWGLGGGQPAPTQDSGGSDYSWLTDAIGKLNIFGTQDPQYVSWEGNKPVMPDIVGPNNTFGRPENPIGNPSVTPWFTNPTPELVNNKATGYMAGPTLSDYWNNYNY